MITHQNMHEVCILDMGYNQRILIVTAPEAIHGYNDMLEANYFLLMP
jgi:hypothetical protein